ncbi:hypothetical protein GYMLUDRAFT_572833 [Collybiopsis luxurians FD-317 M1]|uniref:PH domain-containing protein n=1 Tax=Collybiopsis luxurians FD-317 M1 TaxID=944289 RepID=A0A0D0C0I3_9AGAR|nr:hypothetical protein GYMLUDRAFT_572833 [Collybiopsis luxurians FD-317 M1]
MVLSLTYTAVTRCGLASIKKSGISFKGWKERWVILKPNFLLVYKNTQAHDFIFRISLASIKDMCIRDESAGRPRCLQITMRGGTQYLFTFQSETEFDGWYDDIYRLSPLAPVLIIPEGGEFDEEDIIDGYLVSSSTVCAQGSRLLITLGRRLFFHPVPFHNWFCNARVFRECHGLSARASLTQHIQSAKIVYCS